MGELNTKFKSIQLAIFDLDGVVYRGNQLISGVDKTIRQLKNDQVIVKYNSNNSTITREMYVEKLENYGISSTFDDFYTSASITASQITQIKRNAKIFIIGEVGLKLELEALGHTIIIDEENYEDVDFVIAGLDRSFTYDKLAIAQKCLLDGKAEFYATNDDPTLPVPNGLKPGAGVMVNAITTCTNKKPEMIFGKPNPFGINLILKDLNIEPKAAYIFGDRLNTDISAGNQAGVNTVAVLTGVTTYKEIMKLKKNSKTTSSNKFLIPDIILEKLKDIYN